ncbi:hypothetical protein [Mycobacterium sp. 050134]|uniref:hypothetical protein n=1 Tax=Mycobacterium sp. 050134 TaxID=3096111 RepID=UPI002ED8B16B
MVKRSTAHVDARLVYQHSSIGEAYVLPAQARDLAPPEARKSEVSRMTIAILRDAGLDDAHLIGGDCLELPDLVRHAIDQ